MQNEKKEPNIEKILKEQTSDLREYKSKFESSKIAIKDQSKALKPEAVNKWVKKGLKEKDIYWAYTLSNQYKLPLDEIVNKIQSGEIGYFIAQEKEKEGGNK